MESTTWSFIVPLYPVNFSQITRTLLRHASNSLTKFVPELQGILVSFKKDSLKIITQVNSQGSLNPSGLFRLHPELNHLRISVQINVDVFRPKEGLELDSVVTMVRPNAVFCSTDVSNVTIAIPCLDAYGEPRTDEASLKLHKLKPNDKVRIKLSHVSQNLGSFMIRGELVDSIKKPTQLKHSIKIFEDSSSDEESPDISEVNKVEDIHPPMLKRNLPDNQNKDDDHAHDCKPPKRQKYDVPADETNSLNIVNALDSCNTQKQAIKQSKRKLKLVSNMKEEPP